MILSVILNMIKNNNIKSIESVKNLKKICVNQYNLCYLCS